MIGIVAHCVSSNLQAQAEERAAMLRAQLEERKKAILQRINQEGKEKLEKVCYMLKFGIRFLHDQKSSIVCLDISAHMK